MGIIHGYFFRILAIGITPLFSSSIGIAGVTQEVFENTLNVINSYYQTALAPKVLDTLVS